jgi:predicted GTPase
MATGHTVGVGHELESCTSEVTAIRMTCPEISDSDICLVDTPGFDDTARSDVEIFELISEWLNKT